MTTEIHRKVRPWLGAALVASTLALTACGGGDGPGIPGAGTTTPATVPDSAKTIDAFFAFLTSLVSDDTSEPVVVGDFTPENDDFMEAKAF